MIGVYLQGQDEPQRTIPADTAVLGIVIGDSNAVGLDTHLVGVDDPWGGQPISQAHMWTRWSYQDILERYEATHPAHWEPLKVGAGQGLSAKGVGQYIGPEMGIAEKRVAQLRPHCDRKRGFSYGIVKLAAFGATLDHIPNPRGTFDPTVEHEAGLYRTLVDRHLKPAIASLIADGKRVLIDAVYMTLGSNDARTDLPKDLPTDDELLRLTAENLGNLQQCLANELGLEHVPIVATLPLYADPIYPRKRTDAIRTAFEARGASGVPFFTVMIDDLERSTDQMHLTGRAQIGHGYRLCSAWDSNVTVLQEPLLEDAETERPHPEAIADGAVPAEADAVTTEAE